MTAGAVATTRGVPDVHVPVLEIGGTHVVAGIVDRDVWTIARLSPREPVRSCGSARVIVSDIVRCGLSLGMPAGGTWGVAIPGPFDYEAGIGRFEGVAKFGALHGFDLRTLLMSRLAAAALTFVNDAEAFLLGEWLAGAGVGHERVMALTLGTGVGSAFLANGAIVRQGPLVPPDGYVHRLDIAGRPLEDVFSRRAIRRRYGAATGMDEAALPDVDVIARLARQGDKASHAALVEPVTALGEALRPWVRRFAPTIVVVGGSIARSWDLIGAPLRDGLTAGSLGTLVALARLPNAALVGAAYQASHAATRLRVDG